MEYELEHHMKKLKTLYNCLGPNIIGSIDATTVDVFHRAMVATNDGCPREKEDSRSIEHRPAEKYQFESRLLPISW